MNAPPKAEEGPRSFSVFLSQIEEGALHAELSRALQSVSAELADFSTRNACMAKGSLLLELAIAVDRNGTALVTGKVAVKTPTAPRAGSIFWMTPGKNLSPENPKQTKLPLKEVSFQATPPRVLDEDGAPARSV